MRVLIWSPNYAPEITGIPPLVTDAAEWLASKGHEVQVFTAMPNYPERVIPPRYRGSLYLREQIDGVTVHRSWLRVRPNESFVDKVLYEASFALFAARRIVSRLADADVVVCVVPSLAAAATLRIVLPLLPKRTRPRFVLWIQDLVLAAAATVEGFGGVSRRLLRTITAVEHAAARAADVVLVCSPGFREHFLLRGLDKNRVVLIYNWVDTEWIRATPQPADDVAQFLYAGNIGYTQGLETLVAAARLVGPSICVKIVGAGNTAERIRFLASRMENVAVQGPVPSEEFPELLADAYAHVLVQRQASAGVNFPSKISSYLASGRPVVASINSAAPAAELLRASGASVLVPPEDPSALAEAMTSLAAKPALAATLGANARAYALKELEKKALLTRFEEAVVG
jgi:colanic acid biosynthesis glycosyl transferase WcaI